MKVNEIVMVTENRKGTESNFLMTITDYLDYIDLNSIESRHDVAEIMLELGATLGKEDVWSEIYNWANKTISARFCSNEKQLQHFLQGHFNSTDQNVRFDEGRCSKECMEKLRSMGMNTKGWISGTGLSYTKLEASFKQGQILHNFNNHDYRVMEKLSDRNLLLMDIRTGNFNVAEGVSLYARHPKGEEPTEENSMIGIEWGQGVYFSNTPSAIDFRHIRQKYGKEEKIESISDYREMLEERFLFYAKLSKDSLLSESVKKAITYAMYEEFGTGKIETVREELRAGKYDKGFTGEKEAEKKQAR